MKRNHKTPLDVFADSNMTIDPKFRANLKKQVLHSPKAKKQARWPKYALASTAFAVVVVALAITGLQRPTSQHPLGPQKVSAAELLRRAEVASKKFDFTKYNYFELHSTEKTGPGIQHMKCSDPSYRNFSETSGFDMYAYRAHDDGTEAYYQTATMNGKEVNSTSVYDDTPTIVVEDYLLDRNTDLANRLNTYVVDGQPNNLIVDSSGQPVTDDRVAPIMLNGRLVYEFFTKDNPDSSASIENAKMGCYNEIINRIVIDADNSLVVVSDSYLDNTDSTNLIQASHYAYVNENLSAGGALKRMTTAGFNKETALPEYPDPLDGGSTSDY